MTQNTGYQLIFFGDDNYSLTALKAILRGLSPADITIITRPPKPIGRKQILTPSPVELFAKEQGIPVIHYDKNNPQATISMLQATAKTPLMGVLASFGYIIPESILNLFPHGIINIHPSLLPQYRGSTPVQHAIALGDQETGVTLFKLTPEIDKGEIIAQTTEPILSTDTTPTLSHRLFTKGAQILINFLQDLKFAREGGSVPSKGTLPSAIRSAQKTNLIYTRRFSRQTGFIPWKNFYAMMENQPLPIKNLKNPLLRLRAQINHLSPSHRIQNTQYWLLDLARGLNPWPSVWTIAPTSKNPLRLKLIINFNQVPSTKCQVLIENKPNPITWPDFKKYYLTPPHDQSPA